MDDQFPAGLLNPSVTRYAFIDFGESVMYASDTDINTVEPRTMFNAPRSDWKKRHDVNPFWLDVTNLGEALQQFVRVNVSRLCA